MLQQARGWNLERQICGRGGVASSGELDRVATVCTADDEPAPGRRGHTLLPRWLEHAPCPTSAWTPCDRDDDRVQWRAISRAPCESDQQRPCIAHGLSATKLHTQCRC